MALPTYDPTNVGNAPGNGPLRAGGTSPSSPVLSPADLPSTKSKAAAKQEAALEIARDLWEGPEKVRDQGPKYLPKAPGEEPAAYSERLTRSVFFNMFAAAIEGLVGFVFRKDPELGDDVPPVIAETHWENIDLAGTHGDVFLRDLLQDAMIAGHAAILVDYPATNGQQTREDEMLGGIRPYWVPIKKDQILSWRETVVNGQTVLQQVVLKDCRMVPDGTYGEKEQTQYRVFVREDGVVRWRVEEVTKQNQVLVIDEGVCANQTEIPIAEIVTSGREGRFCSKPTLADVMYLNIAHYQQWSDYATSIHKTCVPIFTAVGFGESNGPIVLGPNTSLVSNNPNAKAEYVSHDGASLASCKQALDDLVRAIADMSLSMLASEKRAAETAKAKTIDKGATDSKLAVTARGMQDGAERALGFHAKYMKLDDGGSIEVNREYTDMTMDPALLTAYVGAIQNAGLPTRILTEAMQEGGLISEDVDLDELDAEMEANAAAKQEQAMQAMQAVGTDSPNPSAPPKPRRLTISRGPDGKATGIEEAA